jgi:hypothetical protein
LDLWFKSYEVFKISGDLWACCQPLPMQQNLSKSAQNCQNSPKDNEFKKLWNSTKNWDFGFIQKRKLPCVEGAPKHEHTIWIFNLGIFCMPFSMSKNGICMQILAHPFVQNVDFFKVPYVLWTWDFVEMYLTNLGTRIWSLSIHT